MLTIPLYNYDSIVWTLFNDEIYLFFFDVDAEWGIAYLRRMSVNRNGESLVTFYLDLCGAIQSDALMVQHLTLQEQVYAIDELCQS